MAARLTEKGRVLILIVTRALLMALPFIVYFAWREWARRSGRETASAPWLWLTGAGAVLVGLSLMATAVFHRDNRGQAYVPAEAHPGGRVTPGGFDPQRHPAPASPASPNTSP